MVCLDQRGDADGAAIVWLDNRAHEEARELEGLLGGEAVYEHTGQIEVDATWPACKLAWLRRYDRERFDRAAKFALLEDWLLGRLCGEVVGEESLYGSTLLFDIATRSWWPAALEVLELGPERLVPVVAPGSRVGYLSGGAAVALGLRPGIPVVAGGLDQVLAAAAGGNIAPGVMTEMTGTTVTIATTMTDRPPTRELQVPMYVHVIPEKFCALMYAQTGGLMLRWLRDSLFSTPGDPSSRPLYDELVAEASAVPPGSDDVLVLPHLAGAHFPEFDHSAKAAIFGLTLAHGRGHVVRATMEAVAYVVKSAIHTAHSVGVDIGEVRSLGARSAVPLWRQIKADVCGLPVSRIGCAEASLLGAALLAAVANGEYDDLEQAVPHVSHPLDVIVPDTTVRDVYERSFCLYRLLYTQLAPLFQPTAAEGRH